MVKKALFTLIILIFVLFAYAQDYYFQVRQLKATVQIDYDQTKIIYQIVFYNEFRGKPIDIIDIGLPNENYRLSTAVARINNNRLYTIKPSEYVKPGVEIHLHDNLINPSEEAALYFEIIQEKMVFQDDKDPDYASTQFKTTWFDQRFLSSAGANISITFILPPGTDDKNCRYHNFENKYYVPIAFVKNDRLYYQWNWENVSAGIGYVAGASFPKNLVARVDIAAKKTLLDLFLNLVKAFFIFFFTFLPILFILIPVILAIKARNLFSLKRGYLPPKIGMESGGIKMGLTVPEVAVLQQQPLSKVLLLIIFGLVKKGLLEIKEQNYKYLFNRIKREFIELRAYETDFFAAIDQNNLLVPAKLEEMFKKLIKNTVNKMAGFSLKDTLNYYQNIIKKAWSEVEGSSSENIPQKLAEQLDWMLLEDKSEEKLFSIKDVDRIWSRSDYWYGRMPGKIFSSGTPSSSQSISQKATNLVKAFENFSSALVGNPDAFSARISVAVNPPPTPSSFSGGSSGGSGCACACACACAGCACACAGGGR